MDVDLIEFINMIILASIGFEFVFDKINRFLFD